MTRERTWSRTTRSRTCCWSTRRATSSQPPSFRAMRATAITGQSRLMLIRYLSVWNRICMIPGHNFCSIESFFSLWQRTSNSNKNVQWRVPVLVLLRKGFTGFVRILYLNFQTELQGFLCEKISVSFFLDAIIVCFQQIISLFLVIVVLDAFFDSFSYSLPRGLTNF